MKHGMILGLITALCIIAGPVMAVDLNPMTSCPSDMNSCTANEAQAPYTYDIGSQVCEPGATIDVNITVNFCSNADRYDLGVIVAEDGGILDTNNPTAQDCDGLYATIPPFDQIDGDACGDIEGLNQCQHVVQWTFETTVDCDNVVDGTIVIPSCRFWRQPGANEVCNGPTPGVDAGTGSKCDCTPFTIQVPQDLCNGINCDDSNDCTTDSCNQTSGSCEHVNNTDSCDDGNACTEGDTCSDGSCAGGSALTCNDQDPCTTDSCNTETGCVFTPNDSCGTAVPEFPSLALPAAMIIGFLGAVFFIQGTKKQ